jgi:hypothetical protein
MKKLIAGFTLVLFSIGTVALFQNCAKTDFTSDAANAVERITSTGICTDGKDITKPTKIFMVVDESLSNVSDAASSPPRAGTDDNKRWRSKVIHDVVAKYGDNKHVYFGLVSFKGKDNEQPITAHIRAPGSNQAIFSNDMNIVRAGVDDFMQTPEGPYTPYQPAVLSARDAIQADIAANPGENATYAIIMMTDGVPSQGAYDTDRHSDALTVAAKDTQSIMALSPGRIHFNGVYYYNDSNKPQAGNDRVLKQITETGKGLFLTANTQPEYDFSIDTVLQFEPAQCE